MRYYILLIIVLLQYNAALAQPTGYVSECVEMTNIVFRLADIPEYCCQYETQYIKDLDILMEKGKSHEVVQFVRELRYSDQKSFEILPKIIACLDTCNGAIEFRETVDLKMLQAELEDNGLQSNCTRFITLLNDFYNTSGFKQFFLEHSSYYQNIQDKFNKLIKQLGISWLPSFFDSEYRDTIIIVSPSNGPFNYVIPNLPDEQCQAFVIIGNTRFDETGLPIYDEMTLFATAHELMHVYTNPIADALYPVIQTAVTSIYSDTKGAINAAGYYSPEMMLREWLNNLFAMQSLKPILDQDSFNLQLRILEGQGFIYMDRSLDFLDNLIANNLDLLEQDLFITYFAGHINFIAEHIVQIQNEITYKHPYIVDVFPALNGLTDVKNVDQIIFKFSVPMLTNTYGYGHLQGVNNLFKIVKNATWHDEYTFVLVIDYSKLNSGTEYGILLNRNSFQSVYYYTLSEDFIYKFKTT